MATLALETTLVYGPLCDPVYRAAIHRFNERLLLQELAMKYQPAGLGGEPAIAIWYHYRKLDRDPVNKNRYKRYLRRLRRVALAEQEERSTIRH